MERGSTEADRQSSLLQAEEPNQQEGTRSEAPIDESRINGNDSTTTSTTYWKSVRFRELLLCFSVWLATWAVFQVGSFEPYQRPIPYQLLDNAGDYVRNLTFDESREGDSISASVLVVIAFLLQLCLCWGQTYWSGTLVFHTNLHGTFCAFLLATSLNRIATESVKNYTGYLRPVFYEECEPDDQYQECTSDDIGEGIRKSFPSGHSSESFVGFTLLTLFIHSQFGMDHFKRTQQKKHLEHLVTAARHSSASAVIPEIAETDHISALWARCISTMALLPMGMALYIAAQRVRYNMHHPADVVGGSVLGGTIAAFVHSFWF